MNETYPIWLSIVDFLPNLAFFTGAIYLVRWSRKIGARASQLAMITGSSLVLLGGTTKAIWKLLITLGLGDYWLLNNLQFMVLAPGFLLMFISVFMIHNSTRKIKGTEYLAMAVWKIPLLAIMTISSLGLHIGLSVFAFKGKIYLAGVLFILSVLLTLGMAGMATGDQSIANQWIEEIVNSAAQLFFAGGSYLLDKTYQQLTSQT